MKIKFSEKIMNTIEELRANIIEAGGIIVGDEEKAFTYFLNGGLGAVSIHSLSYCLNLASVYKPSKENGTGSQYREDGPYTMKDLKRATTHVIRPGNSPVYFYKNLKEYLLQCYNRDNISIFYKGGSQTANEYIEKQMLIEAERIA